MAPFFIEGTASEIYSRYRAAATPSTLAVHVAIEGMWARYEALCLDPGFLQDARNHFYARVWQMQIACAALDRGYAVERSGDDGPDVLLVHEGRRLWIEATVAEPGDGPESAVRSYGNAGVYTFDERKRILRYTAAIASKAKQYAAFVSRGIVNQNEPFVLAILAAIEDADLYVPGEPPDIVRSVYPVGPLQIEVPIAMPGVVPRVQRISNAAQPSVAKHSVFAGQAIEIPTRGFVDGSLSWCSALLFQAIPAVSDDPVSAGADWIVVRNHTAKVPLGPEWFPFAQSWWSDGVNLYGPSDEEE